jgi:hypothetical protein
MRGVWIAATTFAALSLFTVGAGCPWASLHFPKISLHFPKMQGETGSQQTPSSATQSVSSSAQLAPVMQHRDEADGTAPRGLWLTTSSVYRGQSCPTSTKTRYGSTTTVPVMRGCSEQKYS